MSTDFVSGHAFDLSPLQAWGLSDWVRTLFNRPIEIHAFILGAAVGALLATIWRSGRPRTALTATFGVLLFTFGAFETVLCSESFAACRHVQFKPWYFLSGVVLFQWLGMGTAKRLDEARSPREREQAVIPLSGVIVVLLLGVAAASIAVGWPVHPITGLATVGGFVGAILGGGVYEWRRSGRTSAADPSAVRRVLGRDIGPVVTAGTILGFGYPRVFWELGRLLGTAGFPLGPITWLRYGAPSVALYVTPALVGLVAASWLDDRDRGVRIDPTHLSAVVFGVVTYAVCLLLATGLSITVWFDIVPLA